MELLGDSLTTYAIDRPVPDQTAECAQGSGERRRPVAAPRVGRVHGSEESAD